MVFLRPLQALSSILDSLSRIFVVIASFLLLLMFLLINVEVAGRYLFNFSTLIADEYSGYLYCGIVMLGLLYVVRGGHLLRVDAIYRRMKPRVQQIMEIANVLLGGILSSVVTYAVWNTFWLSWLFKTTSAQASETYLFIPQVVMPLGMAIVTVAFFGEFLRLLILMHLPESHTNDGGPT